MSEPKILELLTKIEEINNNLKWKSQDVNLSYGASTTVEGIKNANEAVLIFRISDSSYVPMQYLKQLSGKWLSTMAKSDSSTDARCSAMIDFNTGKIENGALGYVDLAISKVLWR